jgi:hypothetical protein
MQCACLIRYNGAGCQEMTSLFRIVRRQGTDTDSVGKIVAQKQMGGSFFREARVFLSEDFGWHAPIARACGPRKLPGRGPTAGGQPLRADRQGSLEGSDPGGPRVRRDNLYMPHNSKLSATYAPPTAAGDAPKKKKRRTRLKPCVAMRAEDKLPELLLCEGLV